MEYKKLTVGDFGVNCYIVYENGAGVVLDPGGDAESIINAIDSMGITLKGILLTHGHFDHVGAVKTIKDKYNAPIYMSLADEYMVEDPSKNVGAMFGLGNFEGFKADKYVKDSEVLNFGEFKLTAYSTPGHTPGCVSYLGDNFILSGDTLFKDGIGRYDFPGGDVDVLMGSIERVYMPLEDSIEVLPGHNETTTMGREKELNIYIRHYLKK